MIACKARLLNVNNPLARIMQAADPQAHEHVGRHVHRLDSALWNLNCKDIAVHGNYAKFPQNHDLHGRLLAIGDRLPFVHFVGY